MMEMKKYKLGDLLDVKRGTSLSGEYYSTEGDYVRLTCGNFDYTNNSFKENTSKDNIFYTGNVREEFIMQKGDIITPLTEQAIGLLGSTAIIPESNKYIQSQDVAKIICNETLLYPLYAFYLISSEIVKKQLSAAAQQTKIRHTSPDKIKDCIVWIPELPEQKRIASILSALDKKIALNRQINQNLEALARQLYDYWFVQFDFPNEEGKPYKSSGGKMVYNPILKREIPEGWEVKEMEEICNVRRGASPRPIDNYMDESHQGMPWLKISDATVDNSPFVVNIKEHIIEEGITKSVEISEGTLVVTNSATPGLPKFIYKHCCVHDGWLVLTGYKEEEKFYLYYAIEDMRTKLERMASGSIFKNLRIEYLQQYKILYPKESILQHFYYIVSSILNKSLLMSQQILSLTKQRDELLPLLMNGQVNFDLSDD